LGKNEPEAGAQVTVPQAPVVVGEKLATAPHWSRSLPFVMLAGQVRVQGFCTVTLKLQLPVRPAPSVTVQVTVVMPTAKQVPDAGLQTTALGGSVQLSLPVGVVKVTVPQASLGPGVVNVMSDGQLTVGFCVSLTRAVNEQVAVLFDVSVAVQVTVVVPFWKVEPEAGTQATVTPGQLSLPAGVV
jgi:hypothetical protein